MLRRAREQGHPGRLAGIGPDRAALARAGRRRADVEWAEGTARSIAWHGEFDLVTMVSHAFQCLVGDDDLRASLAAIRVGDVVPFTGTTVGATRRPARSSQQQKTSRRAEAGRCGTLACAPRQSRR